MKAVGIKALKARLSEYLRAVKAGEIILVTERDQIIAELRPAQGSRYAAGSVAHTLELLAQTGEVRAPQLPKAGWKPTAGLGLPEGSAIELLADVRGDQD